MGSFERASWKRPHTTSLSEIQAAWTPPGFSGVIILTLSLSALSCDTAAVVPTAPQASCATPHPSHRIFLSPWDLFPLASLDLTLYTGCQSLLDHTLHQHASVSWPGLRASGLWLLSTISSAFSCSSSALMPPKMFLSTLPCSFRFQRLVKYMI